MIRFWATLSIFLLLMCCSSEQEKVVLTTEEKASIELFGKRLVASFNNHDHEVVNKSWSSTAFKRRITGLNKTQRSVLSYIFEKGVKDDIRYTNLRMINGLSKLGGKAFLSQVLHFDNHSEITLTFTYHESFSFVKYRIESIRGRPILSDMYDFRDNTWYSQSVKNTINLNARYDAFSKERGEANVAMRRANEAETDGDAEGALYWLYKIPKTHWIGNGLSLKRLDLAIQLNDDSFIEVLDKEFEYNQSTYLSYLYYMAYADTSQLEKVYDQLKALTGGDKMLDSLIRDDYSWE